MSNLAASMSLQLHSFRQEDFERTPEISVMSEDLEESASVNSYSSGAATCLPEERPIMKRQKLCGSIRIPFSLATATSSPSEAAPATPATQPIARAAVTPKLTKGRPAAPPKPAARMTQPKTNKSSTREIAQHELPPTPLTAQHEPLPIKKEPRELPSKAGLAQSVNKQTSVVPRRAAPKAKTPQLAVKPKKRRRRRQSKPKGGILKKARNSVPLLPPKQRRRLREVRIPLVIPDMPPEGNSSSSSSFPNTFWATKMCEELKQELLDAAADAGALGSRPLRLGTDCAGAEAPWFALRDICNAIAGQLKLDLRIDHLFACEVEHFARRFILQNTLPAALFCDLLARDTIAHCLRAQRPRLVPSNLDIYIAGFPCKDFSMLNKTRPCLEGPHASIFYEVVQYIRRHRPAVFILENVSGLTFRKDGQEAPIHEVMDTLRAIPHYQVRGWRVNTMHYHLPQNRPRVYIVGVNTERATLRRPLEEWGSKLRSLRSHPKVAAHAYLLPETSPTIQNERRRLERRAADGARSACSRFGTRWMVNHNKLRAKLGMPRNASPVVCNREGWSQFLSLRAQDTLELIAFRTKQHLSVATSDCIAEISRGLLFANNMSRISPCVTPTGRLWVFNRDRWLIGREMMALQGFPVDDLNLDNLTETEIASLAGNAMSVPVIGVFLYLAFAYVAFPSSEGKHPQRAVTRSSSPPSVQGTAMASRSTRNPPVYSHWR